MAKTTDPRSGTKDLTEKELLDLVDDICLIRDKRQLGEVTAHDRAIKWGCTDAAAANRLNRAEKAGKMIKRPGVEGGHPVVFYSPVVK